MLDITRESTLSLAQAADLLPPGRGGARPTVGCILRWILKGAKAPSGDLVRLDAIRLGGRWVTSREAIQRFAEALTPQLNGNAVLPPRSAAKRRQASERAAKELEKLGI
jgi:hypothetical protein